MKKNNRIIPTSVLVTVLSMALLSCGNDAPATAKEEATDTSSAISPAPPAPDSLSAVYSATGVVGEITQGKDGFMADLKSDDGVLRSMTVSVLRLQDKYKKFNTGDKVTVRGDTIHLGEKVNILVNSYTINP